MTVLDPGVARTLRAVAEVFVPGPPFDPTPGAGDVSAELFIAHYLDFLIPGLAGGVPTLLDGIAGERHATTFAECSLEDRERVLASLEHHEVEQLRELPALLGLLAVAAVFGEWTGQDEHGAIVRRPLGWQITGFEGPSRGRPGLLTEPF